MWLSAVLAYDRAVICMELRSIGKAGVRASRIGLGGYELGPEPHEHPDVRRARQVIGACLDVGVNWLDTSENYLNSANEAVIGRAMADVSDEFLVSTKVCPHPAATGGGSGFRPDQIHAACRDSLRRLGRDAVDMYFLHFPDRTHNVPLEETWGAMAELADEGLVRAVGMSNYTLDEISACHRQRPVDVVQTGLSMIDYLDDRELIAHCGDLGIAVVVYEPLASGILSGKSAEQVRATWGGAWVETPFWQQTLAPGKIEPLLDFAAAVGSVAQRVGATTAQVAIAWVLRQSGVTAAIVGSRNGRHMDDNARAADLELTAVIDELDELVDQGAAAPH
jgi:aryl-alcohol dehydrogenase-like predicted oxidoreductase